MPKYVPPYDRREQHLPGYNFAGPGTNLWKRWNKGVKPMNAIDAACIEHDIVTEPRGPHTGKDNPGKMRAADRRLIAACKKYWLVDPPVAAIIIAAMKAVLKTGARGRA